MKLKTLIFIFFVSLTLISPVVVSAADARLKLRGDLTTVKSQVLKDQIEKAQKRVTNRGNRRVSHWQEVVTKLETILATLEKKEERFKRNSKDTTELVKDIRDLRQKIRAVRNAAKEEDDRTYTLDIRTRSEIAANIPKVYTLQRTNFSLVNALVTEAISSAKKGVDQVKVVKSQ